MAGSDIIAGFQAGRQAGFGDMIRGTRAIFRDRRHQEEAKRAAQESLAARESIMQDKQASLAKLKSEYTPLIQKAGTLEERNQLALDYFQKQGELEIQAADQSMMAVSKIYTQYPANSYAQRDFGAQGEQITTSIERTMKERGAMVAQALGQYADELDAAQNIELAGAQSKLYRPGTWQAEAVERDDRRVMRMKAVEAAAKVLGGGKEDATLAIMRAMETGPDGVPKVNPEKLPTGKGGVSATQLLELAQTIERFWAGGQIPQVLPESVKGVEVPWADLDEARPMPPGATTRYTDEPGGPPTNAPSAMGAPAQARAAQSVQGPQGPQGGGTPGPATWERVQDLNSYLFGD